MAVNPVIIACPANAWVKVASEVLVGTVYRRSAIPGVYLQAIRVAGDPPPADNSEIVGAFGKSGEFGISSDTPIDVYVKALRIAGEVRVDL